MIQLTVNGRTHQVDAGPDTPLLYVLRDDLRLNAAKYGCGMAQCGACTVLVDGEPMFSCILPVQAVAAAKVTTLEGLGTVERPSPIQRAFMDEQAAQCGYCIPGMMMRAQALLSKNANPTEAEIRQQLEPHLCRCGTHMRVLRAVRRASELIRQNAMPAPAAGRA